MSLRTNRAGAVLEPRSGVPNRPAPSDSDITNVDIVVYVLATLGGAERTLYSEEIAAKSYEVAPSRFSWRLEIYRNWPDKYVAKTALEDAKKAEYGALVEGSYALDPAKDGWRLTTAGVKWARENSARVEAGLAIKSAPIPKREAERFRREIRGQRLFREFLKSRSIHGEAVYLFTDLLRCTPDAAPDLIAAKFNRVKAMAELIQDRDISEFVSACARAFPQFGDNLTRPSSLGPKEVAK